MSTSILLFIASQVPLAAPPPVNTPVLAASDAAHVRARAQPILDRYFAAVRGCGARPPFKPRIVVAPGDGIIHYDQPTGTVVLYGWQVVNGELRAMGEDRAKMSGVAPKEAYELIFNETLVAHELGHWLQAFQPERRTAAGRYDNWFAEQNANRLMVAFLREHPLSGSTTAQRLDFYLGSEKPNPVPPPTGTSLEDFFTADTMKIVRGGGYGWYQSLMTRRAIAERPTTRFCTLVAEWLPLKG